MPSLEEARTYMRDIAAYMRKNDEVPSELLTKAFDVVKYLEGINERDIPIKVDMEPPGKIIFSELHYNLLKGIFVREPDKIRLMEKAYKSQNETLADVLYATAVVVHKRRGRCFENIVNPQYMDSVRDAAKTAKALTGIDFLV